MSSQFKLTTLAAILFTSCLPITALSQQATDAVSPEVSTALETKNAGTSVQSKNWMVAVANPHAAEAAAAVLREGGNAIDAAIAAQFMLGLVEPQSSGLGGGAFLVYFDAGTGKTTTLDGRETAPLDATPRLFQNDAGEPLKFFDAVVGGRSVGTPGTPALMGEMAQRWGTLSWSRLISPAQKLASEGFGVSPRLAALVERDQERLSKDGTAAQYFLPGGSPITAGTVLKNPDYANTLTQLSQSGASAFYGGALSKAIVDKVAGHPTNAGVLSQKDFDTYRIVERPPVCAAYRAHSVCGMGPPSSGALTVGQILGALEAYDLANLGKDNPQSWRLIGDASRLAFADRGRYMADSDFVPMPVKGLTDPQYLQQRGELLKGDTALTDVSAGEPSWDHAMLLADDQSIEFPSTTHFSIVDSAGNAVSMTSTIENGFGSRLMVAGFLLNNELTDFSFKTHVDGVPIANRLEPGKRPRSSMSPTIVLKDDEPVFVVGSPGGSRIIGYVAKTIIAHLDWGMDPQKAIALPHLVNRFGTYDLEAGTEAEKLEPALKDMGFETNIRGLNSGLHAIAITQDGLIGGADPRREGIVLGE